MIELFSAKKYALLAMVGAVTCVQPSYGSSSLCSRSLAQNLKGQLFALGKNRNEGPVNKKTWSISSEHLSSPIMAPGATSDTPTAFSFGLEGELNVREHGALLNFYRPVEYTDEQWLALSEGQKLEVAMKFEKDNATMIKGSSAYDRLKAVTLSPSLARLLPERLNFEGNGNVEINGSVFTTLGDLYAALEELTATFGPLYFQTHVVWPKQATPGLAGYTIFRSDAAQLQVLENGWEHRGEREPGKNLTHASLGPISQTDVERYRAMETRAQSGQRLGSGGDSRVVYSSVPRDDSYPDGLMGYEIRTHNKRWKELFQETAQLTFLIQGGSLKSFEVFNETPVLNEETLSLYLKKVHKENEWTSQERDHFYLMSFELMKQTRNVAWGGASPRIRFYWPLRDWSQHPIFQSLSPQDRSMALEKIDQATLRYFDRLKELTAKGYREKESLKEWRFAISQWASEAKMSRYFERYLESVSEGSIPQP